MPNAAKASAVFELKVRTPKMLVAEVAARPLRTDAAASAHNVISTPPLPQP